MSEILKAENLPRWLLKEAHSPIYHVDGARGYTAPVEAVVIVRCGYEEKLSVKGAGDVATIR